MEQFYYTYQNPRAGIVLEQTIYRIGSYHYNWHPELEFLVVLRGKIEVCSQAVCRVLQEDDLILINPNSGHATFSHEPESVAMVLHVDPRFLSNYYEDAERLFFTVYTDEQTRNSAVFCALRRELATIAQYIQADTPEKRLALDSAFYSLMHQLVSAFAPQRIQSAAYQTDEKKMEAMEAILKYIHKNYRKKISLDSLAKASGYNASYLSQLFKTSLGINFYDYLTRIRLREATRQLSQTDERIVDIALENGFSDLKSFNAVFRKTFRKSPTEYRSQLSEDHTRVDLAFKKEYLPVDDALLCKKLAQYQAQEQSGEAAVPAAPWPASVYAQMCELLDGTQQLAEQAAALEVSLGKIAPLCVKNEGDKLRQNDET